MVCLRSMVGARATTAPHVTQGPDIAREGDGGGGRRYLVGRGESPAPGGDNVVINCVVNP